MEKTIALAARLDRRQISVFDLFSHFVGHEKAVVHGGLFRRIRDSRLVTRFSGHVSGPFSVDDLKCVQAPVVDEP
ncbi:hypothetical protein OKW34_008809 [Paraburkholderia youngii]|uniref:hypothetical protein n=1 Tax=Paraburkholderia youngii TaxID=2782701 RepID=UPI003D1BACD4